MFTILIIILIRQKRRTEVIIIKTKTKTIIIIIVNLSIITEKVGKKRNLHKNNTEEYVYNINHHINKIEKKRWSNYH